MNSKRVCSGRIYTTPLSELVNGLNNTGPNDSFIRKGLYSVVHALRALDLIRKPVSVSSKHTLEMALFYRSMIDLLRRGLPQEIKNILKKLGAKHLLNSLFYPQRRSYSVGGTDVTFHFDHHHERISVEHDINSEWEILNLFISAIQSDDVVYDIGANLGTYTMFAAEHTVKPVFAFEPGVESYSYITNSVCNRADNVTARNVALGASDRKIAMKKPDHKMLHASDDGSSDRHAQMWKVDTVVKQNPCPDVIKIDIEGSELELFKGAGWTLKHEKPRIIFCEVHPKSALNWGLTESEIDEVYALLDEYGFELSVYGNRDSNHHLVARSRETY